MAGREEMDRVIHLSESLPHTIRSVSPTLAPANPITKGTQATPTFSLPDEPDGSLSAPHKYVWTVERNKTESGSVYNQAESKINLVIKRSSAVNEDSMALVSRKLSDTAITLN
jgi:hypothetical protein